MLELTIEVTQEDIDQGIRASCHQCPIARAMNRYFGPHAETSVDTRALFVCTDITQGYDQLFFVVSADAAAFIKDFDSGWTVSPETFVFPLSPTEPSDE